MEDWDRTIPPRQAPAVEELDVTMPGRRDRKPDGVFEPGDLIMNRYKVICKLGQGGMGAVYKCFDETAGIEVALKALPPELSNDPMAMEDIKDNFQLVAKLVHQNIAICKNLEKDNSNGNYYLIMECCEGEDLRRWIRRKRQDGGITLADVLPIIRQIADALDYAHEEKIIHRDIKPGNVMIDRSGKIKVLDFGLAAQIHSSMSMVSMAYTGTSGTGPYMAPEQWRGRAQGAPADQYALAVMTYEMLAGRLPFESADTAVLREAVLNDAAEEISGLPKSAWKAIFRAMAKDPAERFENCSDFAAALGGKKIKGTKSAKGGNFGKWMLLIILLALLGGGAGYYFFDKQQKEQARLERIAEEKNQKISALLSSAQLAKEESQWQEVLSLSEKILQIDVNNADAKKLIAEAKQAIAEAEKERLAKIAADKAEEERKKKEEEARIAKLAEEQLDSENAALKVELRAKITEIEQKNYAPTQGFDKKISEMKIAFATAQEAKLPITANKKYKEAKALADWILVNGEARKAALTAKNQSESNRRAAAKYEPATYASNLYNSACNAYNDGGKLFKELKFSEAKSRFESAANDFNKAEKSAFDNKQQFLSDKAKEAEKSAKWNELKVWAGKIQPLNSALAAQFRQKAEKELLAIAVEKELASARQAKSSGNWQQVHDYALAALKLDASNGEAKNLKQEAENHLIPTLEIIAYVNGNIVTPKIKALKTIPVWESAPWKLQKGNEYEFDVTYKSGDDEYYGKIPAFTCSANGPHQKTVYLKKVVFNGTVNLPNGVKLEMVKVEPGTFTMSHRDGDNFSDEVEHTKTLTKTFYIGKYEVTQEQWSVIMGTTVRQQRDKANTSWPLHGEGSRFPIYYVSWHEAMEFCEKMNRYAPPGWKFTLPTETQWEFAARGGNNSRNYKYSGSNNIGDVAWYDENSNFTTHEIGGKDPNELGLYDMSGNVLEWCLDNSNGKSNNMPAEFSRSYHDSDGSYRVRRGGHWLANARGCRSACRVYWKPGDRLNFLGFRLALVLVQ